MADRMDTEIFAFDSQSLFSSPASGSKVKNLTGDCPECQDTVTFEDTMELDSPLVETQLENLDFDTQVVDDLDCVENVMLHSICEYEREVVLDSEDEGIHRTETDDVANAVNLNMKKLSPPSEKAEDIIADSDAFTDHEHHTGNKVSSIEMFTHDRELASLNYIGSQEPGESSQANALGFVDHFLTINTVNLSPGIEPRKIVRTKSPPFSCTKGPQSLARRIKAGAPVREKGAFEWVDFDEHRGGDFLSNKVKASFEYGGSWEKPAVRRQKARCPNSKKRGSSSDEHEENKEFVDLLVDLKDSTHPGSTFVDNCPSETCKIEQVSEMRPVNKYIKHLDEQFHAEASWQQLEATPDMFDVGINTQIAAEAMEALLYAPPVGYSTGNAYQGPGNTLEDSSRGVTKSKAHFEQHSFQNIPSSDFGGIAKSKQKKRSARKYSREISSSSAKDTNHQELDFKLAVITKAKRSKLLTTGQMNGRNPSNKDETSSKKTFKSIEQRKAEGAVGSTSIKEFQKVSLGKGQSEGESVAQQTAKWMSGSRLEGVNDQSDNPGRTNDAMENCILTYRRKRRRAADAPSEVLSDRKKCFKFSFSLSGEAGNSKLGQQVQTGLKVASITSFLNFDTWKYPRGKRSRRKVQRHSNAASNLQVPFTVGRKESNTHSVNSQEMLEDNDKPAGYNLHMKEKAQSIRSGLFRHSLETYSGKSLLTQNFDVAGKIDNTDTSSFNGAEKNNEFGVLSNKNQPFGSELTSTNNHDKCLNVESLHNMPNNNHKKPCNKNLPKSSLLKELIRLGVPGLTAGLTWKDLRKRRDMAYVRVLFSQHLDDDIIKQQKKILVRLGISSASCSMDATHFIADRFARTRNMLEVIALGKPVVTHLWLESCGQASCLIDEKNFILRDTKKEREIGFSMPASLTRASQRPLLKGQRVFITPNIKPDKEIITSLVNAVHGQPVERSQIFAAKDQKIPDDLLILSCEEDKKICFPFLDKGTVVYSSELLLNGIVIQKLEYERHQLFTNGVKRYQSNKRSRMR